MTGVPLPGCEQLYRSALAVGRGFLLVRPGVGPVGGKQVVDFCREASSQVSAQLPLFPLVLFDQSPLIRFR